MSSINLARTSALFIKNANKYIAEAASEVTPLWNIIPKTEPSEADGVEWYVSDQNIEAMGFLEGGTFSAPQRTDEDKAALAPAYFQASIRITGRMMDAFKRKSETEIGNVLARELKNAVESFPRKLEAVIKGGVDVTSGFIGLTEAFDNNNVYAGLDRTTNPFFAAYVNDNGGTPRPLTEALIKTTDFGVRVTRQGMYNLILGSPAQIRAYQDLGSTTHRPQQTYNIETQQKFQDLITGIGTTDFMKPSTHFNATPMLEVVGYPADRIDFVQWGEEHIALEVFRPVTVAEVRRVADDFIWDLTYGAQMRCRNPYKHVGSLVDLS